MSTSKKKIEDEFLKKVECAINCTEYSMRRNKLSLLHMCAAIGVLEKRHLISVIREMRDAGKSIHFIARAIHMDDKRVSAILKKENIVKPSSNPCACCKKSKKR